MHRAGKPTSPDFITPPFNQKRNPPKKKSLQKSENPKKIEILTAS
jgi:hypothetical protein